MKKIGAPQTPFHSVNSLQTPPPGTTVFPGPPHPQSGPHTGSVVPLFRNGAQYAPGWGSADPLFSTIHLEVFHKQGVRMIIYDGESRKPSEIASSPDVILRRRMRSPAKTATCTGSQDRSRDLLKPAEAPFRPPRILLNTALRLRR
jgi:hypothetical protein